MAWNEEPPKSKDYLRICGILQDFVNESTYSDIRSRLSDESIDGLEAKVMESDTSKIPSELVKAASDILRSEFRLDYDDLVIEGGWMEHLPKMVARNYLLRHFLELGNSLDGSNVKFYDATLNAAADDYTGFIDLIVVKIQTLGEETHYTFTDDDVATVEQWLDAILMLMEYCRGMLDMSSTLRPSLFQMRNRRMEGRIRSVIEMSTYNRTFPELKSRLEDVTRMVDDITSDKALRELQLARNARYKEKKMRLYRYTVRCTEDLNNQLEACDPYDFTHRADLRKQLEQVQIFQRSFDKDR